jgi:hypothetical protein
MKINWQKKLTSRKFWMAVIAFVTSLFLIFGGSAEQADKIAGVILQGATLLAYCIGEGFADGKGAESGEIVIPPAGYPEPDSKDDKYWD